MDVTLPAADALTALPRAKLQRLAKQFGIKANLSSATIITELTKKRPTEHHDDHHQCRRVLVPRSALLRQLKMEILKAFEDQYAPDEITLYTRNKKDDLRPVTSDEDAKMSLLQCTHAVGIEADDQLLIVSALSSDESELMVMPAMQSATKSLMNEHMTGGSMPDSLRHTLVNLDELFAPLPLPSHRDDWLAQYAEEPQSVRQLLAQRRLTAGPRRAVIFLQPFGCAGEQPHSQLFDELAAYLRAFFHGEQVELLPPVRVDVDVAARRASLLGETIEWRDHCAAGMTDLPHGQLKAKDILRALKGPQMVLSLRQALDRLGKSADGVASPLCVLGVTLSDLYVSDDDVFTTGLANLGGSSRYPSSVLSFYRYQGGDAAGGVATRVGHGELLYRACKTAAHEIMHTYGITHCALRLSHGPHREHRAPCFRCFGISQP